MSATLPASSDMCLRRVEYVDPRLYQIAALTGLLVYGWAGLDFSLGLLQGMVTINAALVTQWVCSRAFRIPRIEYRSALISGLSLCLLLRTNSLLLAAAAAALAIASKFLLRWRGKHLFNPANFGLILMLSATGQIWVSPGQWGSAAFFAFLLVCLGGGVVQRAARADVTVAFLVFHAAILLGRSWWLGEPLGIPLHRLENGALLLFAFFMISDPKTTPDSRAGRILFAGAVAAGAGLIQFVLFRPNSLLWSLGGCAVLVPLLDRFLPAARYQWNRTPPAPPAEARSANSTRQTYEPVTAQT